MGLVRGRRELFGVFFANVVAQALGNRTRDFEVDREACFLNGFGRGIAKAGEANVVLGKIGEIAEEGLYTHGGEQNEEVKSLVIVGIKLRLHRAKHGTLRVVEFLGIQERGDLVRATLGERNEKFLVLVLRHGRDEFGPAIGSAEEDLALAIVHILLNVENHLLGNSEILHLFRKGDAQFLAECKEVIDGMARIEHDGRVVEHIDFLSAKLASLNAFYFDKGTKGEFYAQLMSQVMIRGLL